MSRLGTSIELKIDNSDIENATIGVAVCSDTIAAGGHNWMIACFPNGRTDEDEGYFSIFLILKTRKLLPKRRLKVNFDVSLMGKDGTPSLYDTDCYVLWGGGFGWPKFVERSDLEPHYVANGCITFVCRIVVAREKHIRVPPSDMGAHFGDLLREDGDMGRKDVSFLVDGEAFSAHRLVLSARSPVFKAELFGPMIESTAPCITIHDMKASTFEVLLRFLYTDCLREELSTEQFQDLLAAADRYALDRLKLMCAEKLWDSMSVDTVATTLAYAEMYNCPELKTRCMDFFMEERNFKKVVLTTGYLQLMQNCPCIMDELKARLGT